VFNPHYWLWCVCRVRMWTLLYFCSFLFPVWWVLSSWKNLKILNAFVWGDREKWKGRGIGREGEIERKRERERLREREREREIEVLFEQKVVCSVSWVIGFHMVQNLVFWYKSHMVIVYNSVNEMLNFIFY
jgi:hypothetical protein